MSDHKGAEEGGSPYHMPFFKMLNVKCLFACCMINYNACRGCVL